MKGITKVSLALCLGLLSTLGTWGQTKHLATIKGVVTDVNDALVPNAQIELTNDVRSYKIKTKDDGDYELVLEPGKYKMSVNAQPFDITYRSEILLDADSSKTVNVKVYAKLLILGLIYDDFKGVREHPPMRFVSYGYEVVPGLSAVGVSNGMVRYASKCEAGPLFNFSRSPNDPKDRVTFTYDIFTVNADKIGIDMQSKDIYAFDNVVIESESKSEKYSGTVKIHIDKGKVFYEKL